MIFQRIISVLFFCFFAHPVFLYAQHNDLDFDYQANKIDVKANDLTGARVGRGDFPQGGIFQQFNVEPGFASEADVGLGINPSDVIVYNVLDDLLFWNGTDFAEPDPSTQIRILKSGAPETVVHGSSGHQPGGFSPVANLIGQANSSGFFHDHVDFCLEPNSVCAGSTSSPDSPEAGAYGIKMSLSTSAAGIADSDPFLAVFNFGLDPAGFNNAVAQFADLLPPDLPGDYNRSDAVNGDDFSLWEQEFGTPAITAGSGADGNSDGVVDGFDFLIWQSNFGSSAPAAAFSAFSVPEPSTGAIFVSAICGMLVAGHRRRMCSTFSRSNYPLQQ